MEEAPTANSLRHAQLAVPVCRLFGFWWCKTRRHEKVFGGVPRIGLCKRRTWCLL
jgi:hypothetical protein